jgi:hypothetical protein
MVSLFSLFLPCHAHSALCAPKLWTLPTARFVHANVGTKFVSGAGTTLWKTWVRAARRAVRYGCSLMRILRDHYESFATPRPYSCTYKHISVTPRILWSKLVQPYDKETKAPQPALVNQAREEKRKSTKAAKLAAKAATAANTASSTGYVFGCVSDYL